MIKAGIVGATGYTGVELVRFLSRHPQVKITVLSDLSFEGQPFNEVYPNMQEYATLACAKKDLADVAAECDVIFTAVPHGVSVPMVQEIVAKGKKVIDLGADFRFDNTTVYEKWYNVKHEAPNLLGQAVYGLSEINREKIKDAQVVGNPGCYPTSSILGLAPLLKTGLIEEDTIIIDSKSGVSGAGRSLNLGVHFSECNENFKAYNIGVHRHTPEIEQELSKIAGKEITVSFTPHLVPMTRGIHSTIYAKTHSGVSVEEVRSAFEKFYINEYFVRVLPQGQYPQTKWVYSSNFCLIGLTVDPRTGRVVICSVIDNLVKGASGQAVQNMNIMFGLEEQMGLDRPALYP